MNPICFAAALGIASISFSHGALLSINFVDNSGSISAYTGPGVLDSTTRLWDTMTGGAESGSGGGSVSKTVGNITVNIPDYGDFSSAPSPSIDLFKGYIYSGGSNNGAEFMTLSGLDTSQVYSLAVYAAWGWTSASDTFTNLFSVTDLSGDSTIKTTSSVAPTVSFVEGSNYVVFSNLRPRADGSLQLNLAAGTTDSTKWIVSGLELIPEPSCALLGSLGLLLFWRRRR